MGFRVIQVQHVWFCNLVWCVSFLVMHEPSMRRAIWRHFRETSFRSLNPRTALFKVQGLGFVESRVWGLGLWVLSFEVGGVWGVGLRGLGARCADFLLKGPFSPAQGSLCLFVFRSPGTHTCEGHKAAKFPGFTGFACFAACQFPEFPRFGV